MKPTLNMPDPSGEYCAISAHLRGKAPTLERAPVAVGFGVHLSYNNTLLRPISLRAFFGEVHHSTVGYDRKGLGATTRPTRQNPKHSPAHARRRASLRCLPPPSPSS